MKAKIKWVGSGEIKDSSVLGDWVWEEYETVFGFVVLEYYTTTKKFLLSANSFEWEHLFQCSKINLNLQSKEQALEYINFVSVKYIKEVMEFIDET